MKQVIKTNITDIEEIEKIFEKLKGEIIQEFSVKEDTRVGDQHLRLITNKSDLKFGANDLGIWIESYKKKKIKK